MRIGQTGGKKTGRIAVVSLRSPFASSSTISQDGADGKTAQDGARRRNRGVISSRDAGHQYNIFKSNRISCREFVCINLCPSKSSLCAMLRLLLTKSPIID